MVGGGMGRFWTSFALLAVASAGPLHRYPRESEDYQNDESVYANYTANEVCFSEGEVFQKGDMMPNPGPCEECRCEPPSIVCNMVKCATNNNGCRTIQRPNHCCPDYNCECDYNGQLYNDGERLELPEEPCQVCYCKGGEVMCNSITCYHRDDCDPIHVPGQCCPKYENCPVRDMGSSSSDDKNVLVRSTNKTNHVPPKREMNPWLLTKVPSVASSSPPKSLQDPTTEGGTIVIVSDWLTERRTTTEEAARPYNTQFTDEPDMLTSPGHLTTDFKQELVSSGSNSDPFTPVDEVIFTRIDGQKVKEEKLEGPTSTSPKETKNPTNTSSLGSFTDPSTSEAPFDLRVTKLDFKQPELSSDSPERVTLSKVDQSKTTISNEISTEPPIKIQERVTHDGNIFSTATTTHTNNALEHIGNPVANIDLTMKIPARDDQKEIIFENILGLEGLSLGGIEEDTTTNDLFGYYTTESEESATDIKDLTEFAVVDQTKDGSRVGEVKHHQNEDESTSNDYSYTSTNSEFDNDVTTPFFIEVNIEKDNLDKHDHATDLPKIIKASSLDSNNSEMAISNSTPSDESSTKGITLLLETETTKTIDPIETKIKRNKFNGTEAQNNSINNTDTTIQLNNSGTAILVSTQQAEVSEMNPKPQNVKVTLPNKVVKDFVLPTLVSSGDESDDSLETTSDTPVLELNSHVPFLQLGGHENTDPLVSTLADHFQTAISNENDTEAADNNSQTNLTSNNSSDNLSLAKQIDSKNDGSGNKKSGVDKNNQAIKRTDEHDEENDNVETETTTDIIYSTSHIPLSPGDLKVLAEYLINDTIKTVSGNNGSAYVPNPWLKGNLTSEEKMSSILSAANVSIAVMNKTEDKAKKYIKETSVRSGDVTKFEKKEQENVLSGNDLKIGNKTRFIQGKSDEYSDSPKINAEPETHLNDEPREEATTTSKTTNTVLSNTKSPVKNTTPAINENTLVKLKTNTVKPIDKISTEFQSYTPQPIKIQSVSQDSSDNILRFDNVNPVSSAETNEDIKNNLVRVAKSTDSTTSATVSHLQTQVTP